MYRTEILVLTSAEDARSDVMPEALGSVVLGGMPYGTENALQTPHYYSSFNPGGGAVESAANGQNNGGNTRSGPWTDN